MNAVTENGTEKHNVSIGVKDDFIGSMSDGPFVESFDVDIGIHNDTK